MRLTLRDEPSSAGARNPGADDRCRIAGCSASAVLAADVTRSTNVDGSGKVLAIFNSYRMKMNLNCNASFLKSVTDCETVVKVDLSYTMNAEIEYTYTPFAEPEPSPVPLPATAWLMLACLGGLAATRRPKRS